MDFFHFLCASQQQKVFKSQTFKPFGGFESQQGSEDNKNYLKYAQVATTPQQLRGT